MRILPLGLGFAVAVAVAGCSSSHQATGSDDITSLSGQARELKFDGIVYAPAAATDDDLLRLAREQSQTGFGPLLHAEIGVNSRELAAIDTTTFRKRPITVVNTAKPTDPPVQMLELRYAYLDDAIVTKALSRRSTLPMALMMPGYFRQTKRVLRECTTNNKEARDFAGDLWYMFDPARPSCGEAIKAEDEAVKKDRAKLKDPKNEVPLSEVERLYVPVTASLGPDTSNRGASFPEYHRLFAGGVQPGKLVISLVDGLIDETGKVSIAKDPGFFEWMSTLATVFAEHPEFHLVKVEPDVDLASYVVNGKEVKGATIPDLLRWELENKGFPTGFTAADKKELLFQVGERISRHFLTFEKPVKVAIKGGTPVDFTVQILTFFGAGFIGAPYKTAIKNSDVFIYNGHSFIGTGPLDPANFTSDDFPSSYQLFFIDGCISYNYYEKDFIPLKQGGTSNLDLITNGIEAPAEGGGRSEGLLINGLLGAKASYRDLLKAASDTESLRVVDGELDNTYSPLGTPVVVTPR